MKSREISREIEKSVSLMEKKIEDSKNHNLKYGIISLFIRTGIALDYCIPFLASTIIMFNVFSKLDKNPVSLKNKTVHANSYSMVSSNGYEKEYISYDSDYESFDKDIEYSTAWVLNERNLYERDVMVYRYTSNKDINIYDLFNMTNEELSQTYTLCNIKKIQKSKLTDEDKIYNEETIIYNRVLQSDISKTSEKSINERGLDLVLLLIHIFGYGYVLDRLKYIFIKDTIADKLKRVHKRYRPIGKNDFECAKAILEMRRKNLKLINDEKSWQKRYD